MKKLSVNSFFGIVPDMEMDLAVTIEEIRRRGSAAPRLFRMENDRRRARAGRVHIGRVRGQALGQDEGFPPAGIWQGTLQSLIDGGFTVNAFFASRSLSDYSNFFSDRGILGN